MEINTVIERRRLPSPEARRALRLAAGLRLQDVADALDVSLQSVWRWEHGIRQPQIGNRERYAEFLNLCREVAGD